MQRGATTVASRAKGFRGYKVNKGIESPERYVLTILWETLEDHTVGFRQGPLFPEWRAIVGPSSRHRPWSSTSRSSPSPTERRVAPHPINPLNEAP